MFKQSQKVILSLSQEAKLSQRNSRDTHSSEIQPA